MKKMLLFAIVGMFLVFCLSALMLEDDLPEPSSASPASKTLASWESTTVVTKLGEEGFMSTHWVNSGAKEAGFTLDEYKVEAQRRNPGKKIGAPVEGNKLVLPWREPG